MAQPKKGVSPEQLRQLSKELNLTVAAIAEGTGLSKAYISEFRNETRNLSASQIAQLRAFLDQKCEETGIDFPEDEASDAAGEQLVKGLGGMIQRITRPAILLSEDIPKAQAEKLLDLIESNRLKVGELLASEFKTQGGILFTSGDEISPDTEQKIRDIFGLLALNYLAITILQGRNVVRAVPPDIDVKTLGDWLSRYVTQNSDLAGLLPAEPVKPAEKEPALAEGDEE
ncbi:helix-turn-helix domain-containing protein [Ramlibacter humi]|uniref:XRE family transcriptional regulator n=1 Tax=Ramlibacter humi TaxID=2530451 RepID=A0A4Z0BVR7_9BURK|nr:helix-turn-helix transcriptional regulator [Ramlibacter humi]TFZ02099.1 XRE family transcriptional regulator [Ramlibacter humi]